MSKKIENDRRRRIEEARRKERAAERRRTFLAIGGAGIAAIALIAYTVVLERGDAAKDKPPEATEIVKVGVSKDLAGCSPVENADPIPKGSHKNSRVDWGESNTPPWGGDHSDATLRNIKNFYDRDDKPNPENAVHSLEHGAVVVWYDEKVTDPQIETLRKLAASGPKRMLVVPWDRGEFTDGKHIVLTSWGHRQRCTDISGEVVKEFNDKFLDGKDAPEKGLAI